MKILHHQLEITTKQGLSLFDITADIRDWLQASGAQNGFISVTSRHTTTAVMINEFESRLLEDIQVFFNQLVPAGNKYLHNDIHLRDCPPDEPENAHSHLMAMLMGSSEVIPVAHNELQLGQYQSIMLVDLDGPRERKVTLQFMGE